MKVAHIIKSLNPGGIETWLKDLSYINKNQLYYLVQDDVDGFFDKEVKGNGVEIIKTPFNQGLISYSRYLYCFFKKNNIDVVHSHVNLSSGWILFIAYLAGIDVRVAHCHNDKRKEYSSARKIKKIYFFIMKIFVALFSNRNISVSKESADSMFYRYKKVEIIPCGLSFRKGRKLNRSSFGFDQKDIIVTHIGRFVNQKNHFFILDIISKLKIKNVKFIFIGEGDLKDEVYKMVKKLGIENDVSFIGLRSDVNNILSDISDYFILPSKFEGLGLAAVEAQSNHVYTLVSDNVPKDVKISDYIEFLELGSAELWAERLTLLICNNAHRKAKVMNYRNDKFTIEYNLKCIESVYSKK